MADSDNMIREFFNREYGDDSTQIVSPLVKILNEKNINLGLLLNGVGVFIDPNTNFNSSVYSKLYFQLENAAIVPENIPHFDQIKADTLKDKSFLFLRYLSFGLAWGLTYQNFGKLAVASFKNRLFPDTTYHFDILTKRKTFAERLSEREYLIGKEEKSEEVKLCYFWKSLEHQLKVITLPGYQPPDYYPSPLRLGNIFLEVARIYARGGVESGFNAFSSNLSFGAFEEMKDYSSGLTDFKLAFSLIPEISTNISGSRPIPSLNDKDTKKLAKDFLILSKNFYWCTASGKNPSQAYQQVWECYHELNNLGMDLSHDKKFDLTRINSYQAQSPDENSRSALNELKRIINN